MKQEVKNIKGAAYISGIGLSIPEKVVTNKDIEKMVDTNDEWIRTRTGINKRRIVEPGIATSDLASEAGRKAISDSGLSNDDIGMIIVATMTPDMSLPATACLVQKTMGLFHAPACDVNAACSGFLYALAVANQFIMTGAYQHILVIGAETMSYITDWEDRSTCILFGDGAGAVVLSHSTNCRGILSTHLFSDGTYSELLTVPAGGSLMPTTHQTVKDRLHYVTMKGNELFRVAVKNMVTADRKLHKLRLLLLTLESKYRRKEVDIKAFDDELNSAKMMARIKIQELNSIDWGAKQ